jgi:hypothetical protein
MWAPCWIGIVKFFKFESLLNIKYQVTFIIALVKNWLDLTLLFVF